jgi:hypothetical protein
MHGRWKIPDSLSCMLTSYDVEGKTLEFTPCKQITMGNSGGKMHLMRPDAALKWVKQKGKRLVGLVVLIQLR